jgi:chemotaxis protein histidine kinase CheA
MIVIWKLLNSNMEVIKQCREALCLVTYNSQETDPQKVKSLLLQVVEEVKELGGSPERMLFILNKIDVFRDDKNWIESEKRFVEKTTTNIKHELREQLREYTQAIDNLKTIKLSTLPALLALQIQGNDQNDVITACRDADRKCSQLIEETILEDLPRKAENWSGQDRVRVAKDLWQKSYAEEFQQYLNLHITQHFPKLVIPQAIEKFNATAGNSIARWAVQTTTAILNSSEDNYRQECENINNIKKCLELFIEDNSSKLQTPFEEITKKIDEVINKKSEEDFVLLLEEKLKELQSIEPYNQLGEKLYPLYGWRRAFGKGIRDILEAIAKSLDTGKIALEHPNFKRVDISQVKSLEYQIGQLIKLGYTGSVAIKGEKKEAKNTKEKEKLEGIRAALEQLSNIINPMVEKVLEQIYVQEIERMNQAMNELLECYLSYLEEGVNERAPNLIIQFTEEKLNKVKLNFTFTSRFKSGFEITSEKYKSFLRFLFLIPGEKHIARIPSTEELLTGWDEHLKSIEPELFSPTAGGMLELIDELNKKVEKINNEAIKLYRDRLDKARQEIIFEYDKQKTIWEPMQQKAQALAEKFLTLKNF